MISLSLGLKITSLMFAGTTGYLYPPDFTDDVNSSTLLAFWDGTNSSDTTKTNLVPPEQVVPVEGPCLTLAIGDTVSMAGHDGVTSNVGTAVLGYDDITLSVTTGGTIFNLVMDDGTIWACSEGQGNEIGDTTGTHRGTVTAVGDQWADTQDDYFRHMDDGYYSDDSGVTQYPYNPDTAQVHTLNLTITGLGTVTIDGEDYTATGSPHSVNGLVGVTPITTVFGSGEDDLDWSGDTVTGTESPYSITMDGYKAITGAFSAAVTYLLDTDFEGTGTPTGWSIATGGTPDFDYAVSPLSGAQSLSCDYSTKGAVATFTSQSEVYFGFMMKMEVNPSGNGKAMAFFDTAGDTDTVATSIFDLGYRAGATRGLIIFYNGTTEARSLVELTAGQTYFYWIRAKKGTGVDAEIVVNVGSTGVYDDSVEVIGPSSVNVVNADFTLDISALVCTQFNSDSTGNFIYDNVKVSAAPIGDM